MEPSFAADSAASEYAPAADPLKLYVRQIEVEALRRLATLHEMKAIAGSA